MGYNIRPFLFFIEIYNNDKSDRKEYFGKRFFSEGDPTTVFGCVRCARQMDMVGREDLKKLWTCWSFLWLGRRRRRRRNHDLKQTDKLTLISDLSIFQSVSKLQFC